MCGPSQPVARGECCRTLRWSRLAPAWHMARGALWYIIRLAGQAPFPRSPLSSNLGRHQSSIGETGTMMLPPSRTQRYVAAANMAVPSTIRPASRSTRLNHRSAARPFTAAKPDSCTSLAGSTWPVSSGARDCQAPSGSARSQLASKPHIRAVHTIVPRFGTGYPSRVLSQYHAVRCQVRTFDAWAYSRTAPLATCVAAVRRGRDLGWKAAASLAGLAICRGLGPMFFLFVGYLALAPGDAGENRFGSESPPISATAWVWTVVASVVPWFAAVTAARVM